jgi:dihydrofolate synthase/folylpolyglutamate synthase
VSWRERFRIDGALVAEDDLVSALREMQPEIERLRLDPDLCPSFFDVSTALALALFRKARVDVAAIEVGLGGRLDSTNVVE